MVKVFKSWLNYRRCQRAIRRADRLAVTTGRKQLVLMYDGRPVVMSKQHLKKMIREHKFMKGFTPQQAEQLAIYKTR